MVDNNIRAFKSQPRREALRFTRSNDIRRGLASGEISVRTSYDELVARYGSDGWLEYKQVLREHAWDHGCLVLVDDRNGGSYVAMMEHFGRDIVPEETGAYFATPLAEHVKRTKLPAAEDLGDNVVRLRPRRSSRYSIYRLPFGDYSKDTTAFFEERGEFIWEVRA